MSNKYEATFHPSDGPTDQGVREALVEQLAEAIDASIRRGRGGQAIFPPSDAVVDAARAVLPVVAASAGDGAS